MDTQHLENKAKSNGKWAANQAKEVSSEISNRGQDVLETIQDGVSQLLSRGSEYAQSGSRQAIDLARRYPVQAVAGAMVIGFFLGASIFRSRRA